MGRKGYSAPVGERQIALHPELDETQLALAKGKNLPISRKDAREICNAIMDQNMLLKDAIKYLRAVIKKEAAVPFKRYYKHSGHRKGLDLWNWDRGGFPKKAAEEILGVLENALNNARVKGLNEDKLRIMVLAAHPGEVIRERPDRRGRGGYRGVKTKKATNIECSVVEVGGE